MGRLIIISNRLPFSLDREGDKLTLRQSSGGLVSAMAAGGPASVASVIALTAAVAHNRPFVIILAPRDVV